MSADPVEPAQPLDERVEGAPMFLDFYKLSEQPFGVTPNPSYLFPSRTHCEALAALRDGVVANRGFLALIAEPGMGKTTLLYELLDELRDSARSAFLFQTQCNSRDFFRYVLSELGVNTDGMELVAMHVKLNDMLFEEMLKGKRFVLIVDEAQNLDDQVLETVRLLSNFETQHTKLLQIILAGQPQLAEKLARPGLVQLRQRLAVIARLEPLGAAETGSYVDYRLKVGGYRGAPLFAADAIEFIAQKSRGIPRVINNICYDSLTIGCAENAFLITRAIVERAWARLNLQSVLAAPEPVPRLAVANGSKTPSEELTYPPVKRGKVMRWVARASGLVLLLLIVGLYLFPPHLMRRNAHSAAAAKPGTPAPPAYTADPQKAVAGQVLTVVAGPDQTLREISLLYLGQYNSKVLDAICSLNPELKNPDHIEAGQLIRLPLPPGTLTKVYDGDTRGAVPASKAQATTPNPSKAETVSKP